MAPKLNDRVLDCAVIGSGVGGLYALQRLRDQMGLDVHAFDDASDVGGTWYWNRYPGCRVDTEASIYCYSFDEQMFRDWEWSERYPRQPEVLAYLNAVANKHDLKRSISFNTRIVKAQWDEDAASWQLSTDAGEQILARYVFEGVGLLSSTIFRNFRAWIVSAAKFTTQHVGHILTWTYVANGLL